jgi:hypothetical protein
VWLKLDFEINAVWKQQMPNISDFYSTLLSTQSYYLMELREFSINNPIACCELFEMEMSHVSALASTDKQLWSDFVGELKSWVLSPKVDVSNHCVFEYWLNNLRSRESISQQINDRIRLGSKLSSDISGLDNISSAQSVILQNVCLCVQSAPYFTKGMLFMSQTTIDTILEVYLMSNKMHFIESFIPMFIINKSIDYDLFFNIESNPVSHVEQTLFSIVA